MGIPDAFAGEFSVREVEVRPVRDAAERTRWDRLVSEHHYLPYRGLFGHSLRHVALHGDRWVALVGWTAGAFKVGARDRWIGWSGERQFRRLKLVANNTRFVILFGKGEVRNLASRVLGLSLRRLSGDMRAVWGFPVLVAETFVDPSRFTGACYRASNWRHLGRTRGFTRLPGSPVRWRENGQPKEVYVYELEPDARASLAGPGEPADWRLSGGDEPMSAGELRSLRRFLAGIPDFRKARGQRYSLLCYLTIMIAARLAGYRGVSAFGEFAGRLDDEQRKAVGGFYSPSRQCYTVPAASTFHYILSALPPDTLDEALAAWSAQQSGLVPVAMDGKQVRGASKVSDTKHLLVAAVEHGRGVILGQVEVDGKSNEIPALRELSRRLDLTGRVVTMDAIHAQQETARCLVEECGAHCGHRGEGQPADDPGRPDEGRLDPGPAQRDGDRQGAWPHRDPALRRGGPHRARVERPLRPLRPPAGHPHRARADHRPDRGGFEGYRLLPHLPRRRRGRPRRTPRPRPGALGDREPGPLRPGLHLDTVVTR